MAAGQHNPSRRALLGAVVAVSFETPVRQAHRLLNMSEDRDGATCWTPDQVRGDGRWERALARFEATEAEMRAVERLTAGGSMEAEEALEEVYLARVGDFLAALRRVMRVRAPSLPALARKIELAIDQEVGTLTGGDLCLLALKRDVRRLMG